MWRLRLSVLAEQDIEHILALSEESFGKQARFRYEALLAAGLREVATDPERLGVRHRDELGQGVRTFHLFHARELAQSQYGVVKRPR